MNELELYEALGVRNIEGLRKKVFKQTGGKVFVYPQYVSGRWQTVERIYTLDFTKVENNKVVCSNLTKDGVASTEFPVAFNDVFYNSRTMTDFFSRTPLSVTMNSFSLALGQSS